MTGPLLVSFTALILIVCAFFYFRSYINKRTSHDALVADTRDEVNRIIMRIDETIDRDISLLDDKEQTLRLLLEKLNAQMEETERRLMVYTRELDRSLINERAYRELSRTIKPVASPEFEKVNQAEELPETAAKVPEAPVSTGEKIRQLAKSGFSSTVIASKLGISISEAELALALLERKA